MPKPIFQDNGSACTCTVAVEGREEHFFDDAGYAQLSRGGALLRGWLLQHAPGCWPSRRRRELTSSFRYRGPVTLFIAAEPSACVRIPLYRGRRRRRAGVSSRIVANLCVSACHGGIEDRGSVEFVSAREGSRGACCSRHPRSSGARKAARARVVEKCSSVLNSDWCRACRALSWKWFGMKCVLRGSPDVLRRIEQHSGRCVSRGRAMSDLGWRGADRGAALTSAAR